MRMSLSDWQANNPIVVDTNTALSALIGGTTRELVIELDRDLMYPEPSYDEIERNRGVIQERAGLSATGIDALIDTIFKHIELVPEKEVLRNHEQAYNATTPIDDADEQRIFGDRDEDDVVFLATAIAIDGGVWSDDGVFKHQNYVPWFDTEDVIEYSDVDISSV